MLAVVRACQEWRHWLLASPHQVTIYSDHKNLRYFRTKQIHSARHFQWQEILEQFNYALFHKKGIQNRIADLLSRRGDHAFVEGEKEQCHSDVLLPEKVWMSATSVYMGATSIEEEEDNTSEEDTSEEETMLVPLLPDSPSDSLIEVTDESRKLLITKLRHDSVTAGHFVLN